MPDSLRATQRTHCISSCSRRAIPHVATDRFSGAGLDREELPTGSFGEWVVQEIQAWREGGRPSP